MIIKEDNTWTHPSSTQELQHCLSSNIKAATTKSRNAASALLHDGNNKIKQNKNQSAFSPALIWERESWKCTAPTPPQCPWAGRKQQHWCNLRLHRCAFRYVGGLSASVNAIAKQTPPCACQMQGGSNAENHSDGLQCVLSPCATNRSAIGLFFKPVAIYIFFNGLLFLKLLSKHGDSWIFWYCRLTPAGGKRVLFIFYFNWHAVVESINNVELLLKMILLVTRFSWYCCLRFRTLLITIEPWQVFCIERNTKIATRSRASLVAHRCLVNCDN